MTTTVTGVTAGTSSNLASIVAIPGPAGSQGPTGSAGATGPTGPQGVAGPQGSPTTVNGKTGATIVLALSDLAPGTLPTTLPATPGLLWNNGGVLSIS